MNKVINKNDLETINQIADYRCREYYETVLEALIVLVIGVIVGLTIFKVAPTTSDDTKSNNQVTEQQNIPAGDWKKPLRELRPGSPFGMRFHPIRKRWQPHNGTDFSQPTGTPLYAIFSGKITVISDSSCGNGIRIKSGEFEAIYCHLHTVLVKNNQIIKAGETVGTVGSTGASTGPHLHLGIKKNNNWIDPVPEMKKRGLL